MGYRITDIRKAMKQPQLAKFRPGSRRASQAVRLAGSLLIASLLTAGSHAVRAQDFQIVWVVIGEVAGASPDEPLRAGRHLFMANELAAFSMRHVEIAKVEALPSVIELAIGERFCISALNVAGLTATGTPVKNSPMTISVRQDHKEALGLDRRKNDICVKGMSAGEFPIRFASMLPAKDGTTRGAQVFLRIRDAATLGE